MKSFSLSLLLLGILIWDGAQRAEGQETLRCISVSSIDRTEVINERTIAFHLTRKRIYVNTLDHECPDLDRDPILSYSTSTGQLCSLDSITVVDDFGGFSRGPSCGLGEFVPTDEESLAVLRGELEPIEIEVEEIEVEDDVDAGDVEASGADEGEIEEGENERGDVGAREGDDG